MVCGPLICNRVRLKSATAQRKEAAWALVAHAASGCHHELFIIAGVVCDELVFTIHVQRVVDIVEDEVDGTSRAVIGEDRVGTAVTDKYVGSAASAGQIIEQSVVAMSAVQQIIAGTAKDPVVELTAEHPVVAFSSVNHVTATTEMAVGQQRLLPR